MRKNERKNAECILRRVYVGFMDLEKAYGRVNKDELRHVLRIYDVGGKLLNGIMSPACVKVKGVREDITGAFGI